MPTPSRQADPIVRVHLRHERRQANPTRWSDLGENFFEEVLQGFEPPLTRAEERVGDQELVDAGGWGLRDDVEALLGRAHDHVRTAALQLLLALDRLGVAGLDDLQEGLRGTPYRLRVAADALAVRGEDLALGGGQVRAAPVVPLVGVLRNDAEGNLFAGGTG